MGLLASVPVAQDVHVSGTEMSEPQVRWHGRTLVVGDDSALSTDVLRRLPIEPDRCTVVVLDATTAVAGSLEYVLTRRLPPSVSSVRLALSQAGRTGLAQHLADRTDLEIVSPDGPVLLLAPGNLFVASAGGAGGAGGWWTHRRGQSATRSGPRHPAPAWKVDLPKRPWLGRPALVAHAIPCGIWLHAPDRRPVELDDPAYAIPAEPDRITVLIGRPGGPTVPVKALYAALAGLSSDVVDLLTLVPYGRDPSTLDRIAQRLSNNLLVTVLRAAGVPTSGADGATYATVVDSAGHPAGRRIVQLLAYRPGSRYDVDAWLNPLTGYVSTSQPSVPIGHEWRLEIIRCGLWLRRTTAPDDPGIRARLADPGGETFVVDADGDPAAEVAAREIIAGLPRDMVAGLRWIVLGPEPARDEPFANFDPGFTTDAGPYRAGPQRAVPYRAGPQRAGLNSASPDGSPGARPALPAPTVMDVTASPTTPEPMTSAPLIRVAAVAPSGVPSLPAPPVPVQAVQVPLVPASPATVPSVAVPAAPNPPLPVLPPHVGGAVAARRSTPAEQRIVREHLGGRYDVHSRSVTQLLVRMPGIRPGPGESADALVADLVTVAALLSATDTLSDGSIELLKPCLISGLGRLPTFFGAVLAPAPAEAQRWRSGDGFTTATMLRADGAPAGEHGTLAIYSMTGRRASVLSPIDEILFGPGTTFRVLDIDHQGHGGLRVFLREAIAHGSTGPTDHDVLEILRSGADRPR